MPRGQKTKAQNRSNIVTNKDFKNGPHQKKKEKESFKKKISRGLSIRLRFYFFGGILWFIYQPKLNAGKSGAHVWFVH